MHVLDTSSKIRSFELEPDSESLATKIILQVHGYCGCVNNNPFHANSRNAVLKRVDIVNSMSLKAETWS